ncbi:MAG: 2-C-methyl-D-erythritol 4-phosphate cytidylyltransferase [Treponema sp.]|jgi:2-C-methyl-D-erythritol 4-phosphate cytidylyltransferase|nr:2-C-methyl-D-erythritol 4-phosphate cytidylyltransferase [Treponema sp.]
MTIALITAAGKGKRMKLDTPKQFLYVEDKPVIIYTLEAFQSHPSIDAILVVCLEGWHDILWTYARQYGIKKLRWIINGGNTGHDSIYCGLMELKKYCSEDDAVLIHDGNRPLVPQEVISDGLVVYSKHGSSVSVIPCTEVVFRSINDYVSKEEIPREQLFRTQTPHIFSLKKLLWAHGKAKTENIEAPSATCSLMNVLNEPIYFSRGSEINIKITTVDDIEIFKAFLYLKSMLGSRKQHVHYQSSL